MGTRCHSKLSKVRTHSDNSEKETAADSLELDYEKALIDIYRRISTAIVITDRAPIQHSNMARKKRNLNWHEDHNIKKAGMSSKLNRPLSN